VDPVSGADDGVPVNDALRNHYGSLLDTMAERNLVTSEQYQQGLAAIAGADSEEELRRIVLEAPLATAPVPSGPADPGSPGAGSSLAKGVPPDADQQAALLLSSLSSASPGARRRSRDARKSPWFLLSVMVILVLVVIVVLAGVASHLVHTRTTNNSGLTRPAEIHLSV